MWSIQFQLVRDHLLSQKERVELARHVQLGRSRLHSVDYDLRLSDESNEHQVIAYGEVQLVYQMNNPDIPILLGLLTDLSKIAGGATLEVEDDMGLIDWDPSKDAYELLGIRHGGMLAVPRGLASWPLASTLPTAAKTEPPPVRRTPPSRYAYAPPETTLELAGAAVAGVVALETAPTLTVRGDRVILEALLHNRLSAPVRLEHMVVELLEASGGVLHRRAHDYGIWFRQTQELILEASLPGGLGAHMAEVALEAVVRARHRTPLGRVELAWPEAPGTPVAVQLEEPQSPPGHPRYRPSVVAYRVDEPEVGLWLGARVQMIDPCVEAELSLVAELVVHEQLVSRETWRLDVPGDGDAARVAALLPTGGWTGEAHLDLYLLGVTARRMTL